MQLFIRETRFIKIEASYFWTLYPLFDPIVIFIYLDLVITNRTLSVVVFLEIGP